MDTTSNPGGDARRDPLSGEPDCHPLGTGLGAAGGAAAGAALGAVGAGPAGAAIGGTVGALAGGWAGKALAGNFSFPDEAVHWEQHFRSEPYYRPNFTFADYWPAYLFGLERYHPDREFDLEEPAMEGGWEEQRAGSRLDWPEAREAARAAWQRRMAPPGPRIPL